MGLWIQQPCSAAKIALRSGPRRRQFRPASDQFGCNSKQRAHGYSTHQNANDALYRAKQAPCLREDNVPIANSRVAGGRKIEARFPGWKTLPAIKPCP